MAVKRLPARPPRELPRLPGGTESACTGSDSGPSAGSIHIS